jgi:hypothetical protein
MLFTTIIVEVAAKWHLELQLPAGLRWLAMVAGEVNDAGILACRHPLVYEYEYISTSHESIQFLGNP